MHVRGRRCHGRVWGRREQSAVAMNDTCAVYKICATKKLLDRVKQPIVELGDVPSTALGNWHATALFWKPQVALFVRLDAVAGVRFAGSCGDARWEVPGSARSCTGSDRHAQ